MTAGQHPAVLAVRVRKARASSVCAMCPVLIHVGNSIGKVPGRGWSHVDCVIRANRTASTKEDA